MNFVIKKTTELTESEKVSLLDCFIEVFEHERTLDEMYNQYINTPMGFSIHSLCLDKGKVVAAHTAFPSYYWVGDKSIKAFITGDTMVRKDYRDGAVFMDVTLGLTSYMKKEGYSLVFGFPNENSYAVNKKGRLAIEFGRLNTFILPYRIGGILPKYSWLNPVSKIFCRFWLLVSKVNSKRIVVSPLIHKDNKTYDSPRYKRLDGNYCHVLQKESEFYYKLKIHEGVRTAFLIDVIGKSEKRIQYAVNYLINYEADNFDLIVYVGHLPCKIRKTGMIKIPQNFEPKHFYMTGKVLDKSLDASVIYNIENWDVNLSDYDLI